MIDYASARIHGRRKRCPSLEKVEGRDVEGQEATALIHARDSPLFLLDSNARYEVLLRIAAYLYVQERPICAIRNGDKRAGSAGSTWQHMSAHVENRQRRLRILARRAQAQAEGRRRPKGRRQETKESAVEAVGPLLASGA